MNVIYCDSSAIVCLLLEEEAHATYRQHLKKADEIISANLIEAEILAVATREKINLSQAALFIEPISMITPDRSLALEYQQIFKIDYCRGADAYHLACALYLDPHGRELLFLTADQRQKKIAHKLGFQTI